MRHRIEVFKTHQHKDSKWSHESGRSHTQKTEREGNSEDGIKAKSNTQGIQKVERVYKEHKKQQSEE